MTGDDLVRVLERLIATGGIFIDPRSSWQNPFIESFNGKLQSELLTVEQLFTLLEAKITAEDYRQDYNQHRPYSSLGYLTPNEFILD